MGEWRQLVHCRDSRCPCLVIPGEDPGSTVWQHRPISDRTSNVFRAEWIPAYAGMTNGRIVASAESYPHQTVSA